MIHTHRRKKVRSKKVRTRKRKGGAPTPAQLSKASRGLKREKRLALPL